MERRGDFIGAERVDFGDEGAKPFPGRARWQ